MNIIITGTKGFVVGNLSVYLSALSYKVNALSLRRSDWKNLIDLNADVFVHLAGKAHDTENKSDDRDYFEINRDLTIDLFNVFLKSKARDFFYFSSVKAVADRIDDVLTEEFIGSPLTPYGKSKLEAEKYLLKQPLPNGKRLFIIRPCMIHGPGNKGNLNLLYRIVEMGIPWPLGAFHNQRSFLSIDNLNFLIKSMIMNKDVPSGIYNFADDEVMSTNELVDLIAKLSGKHRMFLKVPVKIVTFLSKIGDIFHLPLNSERLKKLTESYIVSNSKIKKVLNIDKLPLTAKEGLELTITSFKSRVSNLKNIKTK